MTLESGVFDVALTYPRLPERLVTRENLLVSAERLLDRHADVLLIEGDSEAGKTTFLAQFVQRHPNQSLCIFLRPNSLVGFEIDRVRVDLGNQIHWLVSSTQLPADKAVAGDEFRLMLLTLGRHLKIKRQSVYIVIDGLLDVPEDRRPFVDQLLEMLPFTQAGFKFVISVPQQSDINKSIPDSVRVRALQLVVFSQPEALEMLQDTKLTREEMLSFAREVQYLPGRLASISRLLLDGMDPADILDGKSQAFEQLFQKEWKRVPKDELTIKLLGTLVFVANSEKVPMLSKVLEVPPDKVFAISAKIKLVFADKQKDSIAFTSDAIRRYVSKQLESRKNEFIDSAISRLETSPGDEDTITTLPELLVSRADISSIVEYYTVGNICNIHRQTKSILSLNNQLARITNLCWQSGDFTESVKFSLEQMALIETLTSSTRASEVNKSLAEGQMTEAMRLAHSTYSIEDRLHLLALIASKEHDEAGQVDPAVVDEINAIAETIKSEDIEDKIIAIASRLMAALPEIAIRLVKQMIGSQKDSEAIDLVMLKLLTKSIDHQRSKESRFKAVSAITEGLGPQLSDPLKIITGIFSSEGVFTNIDETLKKFKRVGDRATIVKIWLEGGAKGKDVLRVVSDLITDIVGDLEFAPSAGLYRELSAVLLRADVDVDAENVFKQISAQRLEIKRLGPTVEYIRTMLNLAAYRWRASQNDGVNLFLEIYDDIYRTQELITKVTSEAWFYSSVLEASSADLLDKELGARESLQRQIRTDTATVLNSVAYHEDILKPIAEALATVDHILLIDLIKVANTCDRRDAVYEASVDVILKRNRAIDQADGKIIRPIVELIDQIRSFQEQSNTLAKFVSWLCERRSRIISAIADGHFEIIVDCCRLISNSAKRAQCFAELLAAVEEDHIKPEQIQLLQSVLESSLKSIDRDWQRKQTLDKCYITLLRRKPDYAKAIYAKPEVNPANLGRPELLGIQVTLVLVSLLVRTYGAIAAVDAETDIDSLFIQKVIQRVPSVAARAKYWAAIALRVGRRNKSKAVALIQEHVRPAISFVRQNSGEESSDYIDLVGFTAPALWLWSQSGCESTINDIPLTERSGAFENVVAYVAVGTIPGDPTMSDSTVTSLSEAELYDLLKLASNCENDQQIYEALEFAIQAIKKPAGFTRSVKDDIRARVQEVANIKFPAPHFIQHDGYKVWIRIKCLTEHDKELEFRRIRGDLQSISNISDQSMLRGELLAALPKKFDKLAREIFEETKTQMLSLPNYQDRIARLSVLLESAHERFPEECKNLLSSALKEITSRPHDEETDDMHQSLVDLAYSIDAAWATTLAANSDTDPKKDMKRLETGTALKRAKIRKELASVVSQRDGEKRIQEQWKDIADASWRAFAKINSGEPMPLNVVTGQRLVHFASRKGLSQAYPVLAYVIEGLASTYHEPKQLALAMRPVHEGLKSAFEIVQGILGNERSVASSILEAELLAAQSDEYIFVREGEGEKALGFIERWIATSRPQVIRCVNSWFSPSDIEIMKLVFRASDETRVQVITGFEGFSGDQTIASVKGQLEQAWTACGLEGRPRNLDVIFATRKNGKGIFHDRWWLAEESGLSVGTSINGIGKSAATSVRRMDGEEARTASVRVDEVLLRRVRLFAGEAITIDRVEFE